MMDPLAHLQSLKARAAGVRPRAGEIARARALRFTQPGFDRAVWQQMCRRGWLGLCVPREAGGSGRGARRFCEVARELGAALAPEPLIAAAMAAVLLPPHHLPAVLSGGRIVLPAWQEASGSLDLGGSTVWRDGRLTGQKRNVAMASGADAFLVTLPDGLALLVRDAPGLRVDVQATPDGGHAATLSFDDTPAEALEGDAAVALDQAIIATAAYLTGLMEGALATLPAVALADGSGSAEQFHADLRTQLSLTRAAVQSGAAAMDGDPAARQTAVSRAMLRAADAAMTVTRGCLRLGRGVGETDAELYRRKATVLAGAYGAPSAHRARCRPAQA